MMVCKKVCADCSKVDARLDVDVVGVVEKKFGVRVAVEGPK